MANKHMEKCLISQVISDMANQDQKEIPFLYPMEWQKLSLTMPSVGEGVEKKVSLRLLGAVFIVQPLENGLKFFSLKFKMGHSKTQQPSNFIPK